MNAQGSQLEGAGAGFEPTTPSPHSHHRAAQPLLSEEPGLGRSYTREAASVTAEAARLAEVEGKRKGSSCPALPSYQTIRLEFPADQQRREPRGEAAGSVAPPAVSSGPGCRLTPRWTLHTRSPRVSTCHHCLHDFLSSPGTCMKTPINVLLHSLGGCKDLKMYSKASLTNVSNMTC